MTCNILSALIKGSNLLSSWRSERRNEWTSHF